MKGLRQNNQLTGALYKHPENWYECDLLSSPAYPPSPSDHLVEHIHWGTKWSGIGPKAIAYAEVVLVLHPPLQAKPEPFVIENKASVHYFTVFLLTPKRRYTHTGLSNRSFLPVDVAHRKSLQHLLSTTGIPSPLPSKLLLRQIPQYVQRSTQTRDIGQPKNTHSALEENAAAAAAPVVDAGLAFAALMTSRLM